MEWTKELPKESGWYWFKFDRPNLPGNLGDPMMMMVYESKDGSFWFEDTVNQESYPTVSVRAFWAGPLKPPAFTE